MRGLVKDICEWPTDMDNGVGIDYGSGSRLGGGGQKGKIETTIIAQKIKYLN